MTEQEMLEACKTSLRIATTAYDQEITGYINSAQMDLGIAGVVFDSVDDLVLTAIRTYVRMRFGSPSDYDRLKTAYDEQKAQLQTATGYTNWGDE